MLKRSLGCHGCHVRVWGKQKRKSSAHSPRVQKFSGPFWARQAYNYSKEDPKNKSENNPAQNILSETQIWRPVAMRQDLTSTTATTTITTTTTELQQPVTQELESHLKPGLSQNTMKIGDRGIKLPPKGFSNMANYFFFHIIRVKHLHTNISS